MQLTDAVQHFIIDRETSCSPKTIEWYKYMLAQLSTQFQSQPIHTITADQLRAWVAGTRGRKNQNNNRAITDTTTAGLVRAIKSFFRFLVGEGHLSADPASALKPPRVQRRPRTLDKSQRAVLLITLQEAAWPSTARDQALILFALSSGCRAAEIRGLTMDDLHLTDLYARVTGKGSKERLVGISKPAACAIASYIGSRRSGHVFLTDTGQQLSYNGLAELLRRLSKRLGFKVTAHMLRHTFGTYAALDGLAPGHIQTLMGHADGSTTRIYTQEANALAALQAHRKIIK